MEVTELQELLTYAPYLYTRLKLERRPGFSTEIADLKIAHWCVTLMHNLEIGMQFPDSEITLQNLEIVQIPIYIGRNLYIYSGMIKICS